jgi:BMFP domain-containing protein YqiC
MNPREKLLGRLGKLGSEALISAANLKREVEAQGIDKLERLAKKLKLVRRAEFESLQAMIRAARETQEEILKRLSTIESTVGIKAAPQKSKSGKAKPKKKN